MKTFSLALLLMASMAFVLLGCSDNPAPVVAPTSIGPSGNTVTSLAKSDGSGATFQRGEYNTFRAGFLDANSGLAAIFGVNDWETFCLPAHDQGMDVFHFRDILLPGADPSLRRILEQVKERDISVSVWDLDVFQGGFCLTRQAGYPPLAVGTVRWINNDNDYLAWAQVNPNVNSYGNKATGTLYSPDGRMTFKLNLVYRFIWDPDGTRYNEVFKLQLTPTGKK